MTNLGIHCALKISGCQSFCGFMYPLKIHHQNFTLEGTLKKYEWEPWDSGNIQHFTVSYNTSCNSDYNLTVQPNSDKYDVFYDLTVIAKDTKKFPIWGVYALKFPIPGVWVIVPKW